MFKNIFKNEQNKLIKELSKKFDEVNLKFEQLSAEKARARDELNRINCFETNPFAEIIEVKKQLQKENELLIPNLNFSEQSDDYPRFSVYVSDIISRLDETPSNCSNIAWLRLYKNYVKPEKNLLLLQAFFRVLSPSISGSERKKLMPIGLSIYQDFFSLTKSTERLKKWESNLAAIEYVDSVIREHSRKMHKQNRQANSTNLSLSTGGGGNIAVG